MGSIDLDPFLQADVLAGLQPCSITMALPVGRRAVSDPGCPYWAPGRY